MPQSTGLSIQRAEFNAELIVPICLAAVEAVEEFVVIAIVAETDTSIFRFPGKIIPASTAPRWQQFSSDECQERAR